MTSESLGVRFAHPPESHRGVVHLSPGRRRALPRGRRRPGQRGAGRGPKRRRQEHPLRHSLNNVTAAYYIDSASRQRCPSRHLSPPHTLLVRQRCPHAGHKNPCPIASPPRHQTPHPQPPAARHQRCPPPNRFPPGIVRGAPRPGIDSCERIGHGRVLLKRRHTGRSDTG